MNQKIKRSSRKRMENRVKHQNRQVAAICFTSPLGINRAKRREDQSWARRQNGISVVQAAKKKRQIRLAWMRAKMRKVRKEMRRLQRLMYG